MGVLFVADRESDRRRIRHLRDAVAFWVIGWGAEFAGGNLRTVLQYLSIGDHLEGFTRGLIDTKDLVYYVTGVALALFLTLRSLESKRWKG